MRACLWTHASQVYSTEYPFCNAAQKYIQNILKTYSNHTQRASMSWHMPEWILAAQSWAHTLAKLYYTRTLKYDMHPSDAHHMSKRPWMLFWGTGWGSLGTATAMGPVPYCAMYSGVVLGGGLGLCFGSGSSGLAQALSFGSVGCSFCYASG